MRKFNKNKNTLDQKAILEEESSILLKEKVDQKLIEAALEAIANHDVTFAKKALLKIAESENKYRSVVENSIYAFFLSKPDTTILDANSAALEMFGYSLEELKHPQRRKIIDLDDPVLKSSLKVRDIEGKVRGEAIGIRKNGERFPIDFSSTIYIDTNGETRFNNILIDITEVQNKEQEIALLMSYTDESFVLVDTSLNIVSFNNQFAHDFQKIFKKEATKGLPILDFVYSDRLESSKELFKKVLAGELQEQEMEFEVEKHTKTYIHRHKPVYDSDGNLSGIFISSEDITKRKTAEKLADQIQKRFKALVENSQDIIVLTGSEGEIIYVSPVCEKITGLKMKDQLGKRFYANTDQETIKESEQFLIKVKANPGIVFPRMLKVKDKDKNSIWLEGTVVNQLKNENIGAIVSNFRDVTRRILAEKELEKERESYIKLFMEAPSIIGVLSGPNHVFQLANPLCEEIIGRGNILGKEIKTVAPELISQGIITLIDEVYKSGMSYIANEMLFKVDNKQDGNLVDIYSNFLCQAYRNTNGEIEGVFFFANDVTEQVHARKEIQKNEKRFRALVENSLDAISLIDDKFNVFYRTPSAERITGIHIKDRTQKGIVETTHPDDVELLKFYFNDILNSPGKPLNILFRNKHKDGHYIWLEGISVNLLNDESVNAIVFNFRDVTERKKIEDQQSLLVSIVNSSDDAIISKNLNGIITSWNYGAEKLFGYSSEEAVNQPISFFLPATFEHEDKLILNKIKLGESLYHYETKRKCKDGHIVEISITVSPIRDLNGKVIGASKIARDITEKKQNEILLKKLNEQIISRVEELAISNAELEQFAYVASHDLQEPLRMVTSFLTRIESKYNDLLDDKGKQYMHFAIDGAIRMRKMILDLLEFSKVGKVKFKREQINLNQLIDEIILLNNTLIVEKNATIEYENLTSIIGSKTPIQQVLQNLITNALKYQSNDNKPFLKIRTKENEVNWEISIQDNGIGIEQQFFDKIFVLFQRLHNKDEFEGTGIGLAICKKIIENHGGKIWVESEIGKGSVFYFTIKKEINI